MVNSGTTDVVEIGTLGRLAVTVDVNDGSVINSVELLEVLVSVVVSGEVVVACTFVVLTGG